jgi:hypothetical protein
VLVSPRGMAGIKKRAPSADAAAVHLGFRGGSRCAAVPIIPVAVVGADDQAPALSGPAAARGSWGCRSSPSADLPLLGSARPPCPIRPLRGSRTASRSGSSTRFPPEALRAARGPV